MRKRSKEKVPEIRNLIIISGDQLTEQLSSLDGIDKDKDTVWMAEVAEESKKVWVSKQRIALFLAAMRHFHKSILKQGLSIHYHRLDDTPQLNSLGEALDDFLKNRPLEKIILTHPGEYSVLQEIKEACKSHGAELEIREDNTFLCSFKEFKDHAKDRKQLRMEYFYRYMRKKHDILMDGNKPMGGKWNFDKSNRKTFGKSGPENKRENIVFERDIITKEVIHLVNDRFADHPGNLDTFIWPTNREQAIKALDDFIKNHLSSFGPHQDAMWTDEPFLSHSLLASSINLKLLHPMEVIETAEEAYRNGKADIESVEGFIRQILGWREYVRGIYWNEMPDYLEMNHLDADLSLPEFYWTGKTDMNCIRQTVEQTMNFGYAHHIQRLMVTGLYAMLAGVHPRKVHEWYLAVYVDAVEWVELPNTLGMSQFADGGIMASKPYAATGKYINRMSNYCAGCKFDPDKRTGREACPFTVLYWDFLARNEKKLGKIQRMAFQLKNLGNIDKTEMSEIRHSAERLRTACQAS